MGRLRCLTCAFNGTSAFCGERRHYQDECYHKRRLSAKLRSEAQSGGGSAGGKSQGEKGKGKSQTRGKSQGQAQGKGGGHRGPDKKNHNTKKDKDQDRSGGNPNPTPGGTNPEPCGGQQNTGPTIRSQTPAQQEQGTKRANEDGDKCNAHKRSRFMPMPRKLHKKWFDVACPADFEQGRSGGSTDLVFWVRVCLGGRQYLGVLGTWATISIVAKNNLPPMDLTNTMPTAAIHIGDGHAVHICGDCEVHVPMGSGSIAHRLYVMDTEAFDFVLGTDFFIEHSQILSLTLQAPYVLQVDHGDGADSVPLEQSEHRSGYLRVCKKEPSGMMDASETEDYQLLGDVLDQGRKEFGYSREDLNVELLASDKQHVLDLYCSKGQNCCYRFHWPSFGMAYGNPRFSELGKVLTKVALERSRMVLCSPPWGTHGGNEYWHTLLQKLTLTSMQLPDDAIYVPLGRMTPIGRTGWRSMLSVVDGGLAPVFWEGLAPAMVQEVQRESSSYTLDVVKDRLWPRDAVETTPGGDGYVSSDAVAPKSPCHVSNPDVVSERGLSNLPSFIHSDDRTEHDAFFVRTCVEEVENAEYAARHKPLLSMRGEEPLDEELNP